MICPDCRHAGSIIKQYQDENNRVAAMLMHDKCVKRHGSRSTWCDCQHQLTGVNWEAINREASNAER